MAFRFRKLTFAMLAWPLIIGCHHPREILSSTTLTAAADSTGEADRIWEAVQETLRRHRFRLDRVDRSGGVISTLPEISQSAFEFWRHDVQTGRDLLESSLNPLHRWVEVTLTRGSEGGWSGLAIVVHKERLSSPDRQFNSTGAAYAYFGDSLPSTMGAAHVDPAVDRWTDLGRDRAMEDYLLRKMLKRAGIPAGS